MVAIVVRGHTTRAIVCAGEPIVFEVRLDGDDPAGTTDSVQVEYLVAQFHGRFTHETSWISATNDEAAHQAKLLADARNEDWMDEFKEYDTVLRAAVESDGAKSVFRTSPLILCRKETCAIPFTSRYAAEVCIPAMVPPSFRGVAAKYSYCVAVALKLSNGEPRAFRVPFRVVPPLHIKLTDKYPCCPYVAHPLKTHAHRLPSLPVFTHPTSRDDKLNLPRTVEAESVFRKPDAYEELLTHVVDRTGAPIGTAGLVVTGAHCRPQPLSADETDEVLGRPLYFNINSVTGEHVARICLHSRAVRAGETLCATIDLTDGALPCHQLTARLETQEEVLVAVALSEDAHHRTFRKLLNEHVEYTRYLLNTSFTVPIPYDATPPFESTAVNLRWVLHLTFLTGDGDTATDSLQWSVPIQVLGSPDRSALTPVEVSHTVHI